MHKARQVIKNLVYTVIHTFGGNNLAKNDPRFSPIILNYHHIVSHNGGYNDLLYGYSHTLDSFRVQMKYIATHRGCSLSFQEKDKVVVTFDDCSESVFYNALPVLEELGIKAYFFIVEESIGTISWIDKYFMWLSWAPEGTYQIGDLNITVSDHSSRLDAHRELWSSIVLHKKPQEVIALLNQAYTFGHFSEKVNQHRERLYTVNHEMIGMIKAKGHKVGMHSRSHAILNTLCGPALENEITRQAPGIFNTDVFAIPFGSPDDYNPVVVKTILDNGYTHVLLNHRTINSDRIFGRINLPDSSFIPEISTYLRRFRYIASLR